MSDIESSPRSWWARMPWGHIALCVAIGVCMIIVCVPCVWFVQTNVLAPTITRDFGTYELLIDTDSLPPGWRVDDTYVHVGLSDVSWSEDQAGRFYSRYDENGSRVTRAVITVWHYDYPDPRDYERMSSDCRGWTPPPPDITFTSEYADESNICCSLGAADYRCVYFAAYSEFLVDVRVRIAPASAPEELYLPPEEIDAFFAAQDQRMADFLDLEPQE